MEEEPAAWPPAWADIRTNSPSSVRLVHIQHQRFRPMFLLEVLGLVLAGCCLVPLILIGSTTASGIEDVLMMKGPWTHDHAVRLVVDGVEAEWMVGQAEVWPVLALVLRWAREQGVDVEETALSGTRTVWEVGHRLWMAPSDLERAEARARSVGAQVDRSQGLSVSWEEPGAKAAAWALLLLGWWVFALTPPGRLRMQELIATARGEVIPVRTLSLGDGLLRWKRARGEELVEEGQLAVGELVALVHRPLGPETRRPRGLPRLIALSDRGELPLTNGQRPELEQAVHALLLAELSA